MSEKQSAKTRRVKYISVPTRDGPTPDEKFPVHLACGKCSSRLTLLKRKDGTYYFCAECVVVTSKVDDNVRGVNP